MGREEGRGFARRTEKEKSWSVGKKRKSVRNVSVEVIRQGSKGDSGQDCRSKRWGLWSNAQSSVGRKDIKGRQFLKNIEISDRQGRGTLVNPRNSRSIGKRPKSLIEERGPWLTRATVGRPETREFGK